MKKNTTPFAPGNPVLQSLVLCGSRPRKPPTRYATRDLAELTLLACAVRQSGSELHLAADRMGRIADRLFDHCSRHKGGTPD
jgi:hypothetical protein